MIASRLLLLWAATFSGPGGQAPQPGGVAVDLPRFRTVAAMSDAEVLSGELGGVVVAVSGGEVRISLRGSPCVPRVGDRVELWRVRQGFAFPVGEWRVSFAEGDDVRATTVEGMEKPFEGATAIVHSAVPSGAISRIGFENTPRPQLPPSEMMPWAERHRQLVERADRAFAEGQRAMTLSPPDRRAAEASWRIAARLNHVKAAAALYRMLLDADGQSGAAPSIRHAAELGDTEAQFLMGEASDGRRGQLPADLAKARAWYRKAAESGSEKARSRLRQIGRQ